MIHLTVTDLDTATARQLGQLADRSRVASIAVRPDTRRAAWLARDLLTSMGVRHDVSGQTRRDADDRQLTAVWLHAHQVEHVIVRNIEQLTVALLHELVEVTTLAGADLWLVADHILPEALAEALLCWPTATCPPDEFAERWLIDDVPDPTADGPDAHGPDDPLPEHLPSVDFPLFRGAVWRQLGAEAALVDELYVTTFRAAARALRSGTDSRQVLRDLLAASTSRSASTVIVRATQAAALMVGIHVRVNLTALLAFDDHRQAAELQHSDTWHQLHAYRQPARQASCVLMLAGLAPTAQLDLAIEDADLEHLTVLTGDGVLQLPTDAAPTLRALLATRAAAGATSDEPLIARLDGDTLADRAVADAINAAQAETGLCLTPQHVRRDAETLDTWARRRHVTATKLEP